MTMLTYLPETASQTAGPYVHIGLIPHQAGFDIFEKPFSNVLGGEGERIRIEGRPGPGVRPVRGGLRARVLCHEPATDQGGDGADRGVFAGDQINA